MKNRAPQEYFRRHSALSDWLRPARPESREAILAEDLTRSERLEKLNELIGLPILGTSRFDGSEIQHESGRFKSFRQYAKGPYAVRAVQKSDETRVVRNRNLPLNELLVWLGQTIGNLSGYWLEFSPHVPNEWACIFIITDGGVVGEVTQGSLRQLTQGDHVNSTPGSYTYDFHEWSVVPDDDEYARVAKSTLSCVEVQDDATRQQLTRELGASFAGARYLMGYFEAIVGPSDEIRFIDFNMTLGLQVDEEHWALLRRQQKESGGHIRGLTASKGRVRGRARVIMHPENDPLDVGDGEIVVCVEPTPEMVPLLVHAGGLIADRGGVLSHAAIVCRELEIPCIVATHTATESIRDGVMLDVDADSGVVNLL